MMAGIHLDVQLYDKVCIFLTEVWQVRSAWNIPDCLILLSLRKKILKVFRVCGGGSTDRLIFLEALHFCHLNTQYQFDVTANTPFPLLVFNARRYRTDKSNRCLNIKHSY